MNRKKALALFFVKMAKHFVAEPVTVQLLAGPGRGARLAGCVGWTGDHWHVQVDKNCSEWLLWVHLWHELAHIHYGDTPKTVDKNGWIDADLIRGKQNVYTTARAHAFDKGRNEDHEKRANEWAAVQAERWWPALENCLLRIAQYLEG